MWMPLPATHRSHSWLWGVTVGCWRSGTTSRLGTFLAGYSLGPASSAYPMILKVSQPCGLPMCQALAFLGGVMVSWDVSILLSRPFSGCWFYWWKRLHPWCNFPSVHLQGIPVLARSCDSHQLLSRFQVPRNRCKLVFSARWFTCAAPGAALGGTGNCRPSCEAQGEQGRGPSLPWGLVTLKCRASRAEGCSSLGASWVQNAFPGLKSESVETSPVTAAPQTRCWQSPSLTLVTNLSSASICRRGWSRDFLLAGALRGGCSLDPMPRCRSVEAALKQFGSEVVATGDDLYKEKDSLR